MISRFFCKAWLLAFIGVSMWSLSTSCLYADTESRDHRDDGRRDRKEMMEHHRDREQRKEHRDHDKKNERQRNMHPELQIATPFNSGDDA